MTLPESGSSARPAGLSDSKTVPAGSVDETMVAPALATRLPRAGTPPPPPPPPAGSPPGGPMPERDYTIPIMVGVFFVALVGISLLGLGVYAAMHLTPNNAVAAGAGTATLLPLSTQVVFIPTTTPMPTLPANATPSQAPTATALPPTATITATMTATATSTQAGDLLTVDQGANLRSGPGIIYQVVGSLKAGDTVPVVGRDVASSWYVISYKGGFGGQGWISSFVTTFNGDKSKLPVVAAPPPPLPTATPKPAGNPNGGLVTGARGVSGMLNLCSRQVTFAVGERVCFVEWIKNNTGQRVGYGILGVTAVRQGGGVQFQTSWSGEQAPHGLLAIDPGCIGPTDHCKGQWEDGMRLNNPGTYQLTLNVCFSDYPTCRGTTGDWEVLSGAIVITVQ